MEQAVECNLGGASWKLGAEDARVHEARRAPVHCQDGASRSFWLHWPEGKGNLERWIIMRAHCGAQIEPSGMRPPPRPPCAAMQTLSSESPQPVGMVGVAAVGFPQHPTPLAQSHWALVPRGCQQPPGSV